MALILADSFDYYYTTANAFSANGLWTTGSSTLFGLSAVGANTKHGYGKSLSQGSSSTSTASLSKTLGSNESTIYLSFYYIWKGTNSARVTTGAISLLDGASYQVSIVICETNAGAVDFEVRAGNYNGTLLGTYTAAASYNTWSHFQVKIVVNSTTGSVEFRKNNVSLGSYEITGVDTAAGTANDYANVVTIRNNMYSANNQYFDDFIIHTGSGAEPNDWIGEHRSYALKPSADTAQKDYTSTGANNYGTLIESSPDGDTSYVKADTLDNKDIYDLGDLAMVPTNIMCVQTKAISRVSDGARTQKIGFKLGETEYLSADQTLSGSYDGYTKLDLVSPATSTEWTASEVNSLQQIIKVSD